MRLLITTEPPDGELELRLEEFVGNSVPKYAVLSHTWSQPRNEVQYYDVLNNTYLDKSGLCKVRGAIKQARLDGYDHIWIDSVCIDRSSSSELSEAINSMYRLYQRSEICYVYLADVDTPEEVLRDTKFDPDAQFCKSRWWTRGWCLQELLAPRRVRFFSSEWALLGDKFTLQYHVSQITTIGARFLNGTASLERASVARRMSWAASRITTREEDIAYCLLGIFSVNMPMLYGEGTKAFVRLQEEIIKTTDDHTIFAWRDRTPAASHGLLADHPKAFANAGAIVPFFGWQGRVPFGNTNMGLDIELPLLESSGADIQLPSRDEYDLVKKHTGLDSDGASACTNAYLRPDEPIFRAAIACRSPDFPNDYLALGLRALPGKPNRFTRVDCNILFALSRTASPMKFYVPQDITISREHLEVPTYQCLLLRSYEGTSDWSSERKSRRGKPLHAIKSSGTIRQYDRHLLPDRNSVLQRLYPPEPYEAVHRMFIIGQARNRIYGWVIFERASDMAVFMVIAGRLLNGEIGFGALRVEDKSPEVTDSLTWSLQPAGSWMGVGGFQGRQAYGDAGGDQAKFDATLRLGSRLRGDEAFHDVDVLTRSPVVDRPRRPLDLANFINSRARLITQRGFSW